MERYAGHAEEDLKVPEYLLHMIRDYLQDHIVLYNTNEGQRSRKVTVRATQSSKVHHFPLGTKKHPPSDMHCTCSTIVSDRSER